MMASLRISSEELSALHGIESGTPLWPRQWQELITGVLSTRAAEIAIVSPQPIVTLLGDRELEMDLLRLAVDWLGPPGVDLDAAEQAALTSAEDPIPWERLLDRPFSFYRVPSALLQPSPGTAASAPDGLHLLDALFALSARWAEVQQHQHELETKLAQAKRTLADAEHHLAQSVEEEALAVAGLGHDLAQVERARHEKQLETARQRRTKTEATIARLRATIDRCAKELGAREHVDSLARACHSVASLLHAGGAAGLEERLLRVAEQRLGTLNVAAAEDGMAAPSGDWAERFRALNRHEVRLHQTKKAVLIERRTRGRSWRRRLLLSAASAAGGAGLLWLALGRRTSPPAFDARVIEQQIAQTGYGVALGTPSYDSAQTEFRIPRGQRFTMLWSEGNTVELHYPDEVTVRGTYRLLYTSAAKKLRWKMAEAQVVRAVFAETLAPGPYEIALEYTTPQGILRNKLALDVMNGPSGPLYHVTAHGGEAGEETKGGSTPGVTLQDEVLPSAHEDANKLLTGRIPETTEDAWVPAGWQVDYGAGTTYGVKDGEQEVTAYYKRHESSGPWSPLRWKVDGERKRLLPVLPEVPTPGHHDLDIWMGTPGGEPRYWQFDLHIADNAVGRRFGYRARRAPGPPFRVEPTIPKGVGLPFHLPFDLAAPKIEASVASWKLRWNRLLTTTLNGATGLVFAAGYHPVSRPDAVTGIRWQIVPAQHMARAVFPEDLAPGRYTVILQAGKPSSAPQMWTMVLDVEREAGTTRHRLGDLRVHSGEAHLLEPLR